MGESTGSAQAELSAGFTEPLCKSGPSGRGHPPREEAESLARDMDLEDPAGSSNACTLETNSHEERLSGSVMEASQMAHGEASLPQCIPISPHVKTVSQLEEAIWLLKEELAEEKRLRAEERRQFAIVQDEVGFLKAGYENPGWAIQQLSELGWPARLCVFQYLRLQTENAKTSRQHTAAEVSAAACRSLAADALADKEYFVRLLSKSHQELRTLTSFVETVLPQFKAKVCDLVSQGNSIVALLAARWPEAELRKIVNATGLADQPLARWALSHSMKTEEVSSVRVAAHRGALLAGAAPLPLLKLPSSGIQRKISAPPHVGSSHSEDKPTTVNASSGSQEGTSKQQAAALRVRTDEGSRSDGVSLKPETRAISDASAGSLPYLSQRCTVSHGDTNPHSQADANPSARTPHEAPLERIEDLKDFALSADCHKDGSGLNVPAVSSALPRPQSAAQRRAKLPDAATSLPSKINRQVVPLLPLGRKAGNGSAVSTARDLVQTHPASCAVARKDGVSEASTPALRKGTVRRARVCKDQGGVPRETQGHASRPPSVRSLSRGGMRQGKTPFSVADSPMFAGTGLDLRATQPSSLATAFRSGSLPSRRTYDAVISSETPRVIRRNATDAICKGPEEGLSARKVVRSPSQGVSANPGRGLPATCQPSNPPVDTPLYPKKKLPPLPPSVKCSLPVSVDNAVLPPSVKCSPPVSGDNAMQHSEPAALVGSPASTGPVAVQRTPSSGGCPAQYPAVPAALVADSRALQGARIRNASPEEPVMHKVNDAHAEPRVAEKREASSICPALNSPSAVPVQSLDVQEKGLTPPCLPLKFIAASEGYASQSLPPPALTRASEIPSGGTRVVQRQVLHPVSSGALSRAVDAPGQAANDRVLQRNPSGPSGAMQQGAPAASQKQLPPGPTLRVSGEWPSKACYAVPQRASLPAGYSKGLNAVFPGPVQHQHAYLTPNGAKAVQPAAAGVPQRQTVLPTNASACFNMQQQYLLQQHNLRQQQLMYQAQQGRQTLQFQQHMGINNMQFFVKNAGPPFAARQQPPAWGPVYSGGLGRGG
ncbi:hypothetical protein Efla_001189 [Eimeria flavescens]